MPIPTLPPSQPSTPVRERGPAAATENDTFDGRIPFLLIAAVAAFIAGTTRSVAGRPSWLDRLLRRVDEEVPRPTRPDTPPPNPEDPTYQFWLSASPWQRAFWDAYNWAPFGMEIHHLIEQQIFRDYPGVFEQAERDFFTNLRGIYKSVAPRIHQGRLREAWNAVYRFLMASGVMPENPQAMSGPEALALRRELLFWAVVIDILLGDQMNPEPVILDDPEFTDILRSLGVSEADIAKFRDLTPEQRVELLQIILDALNGQSRDYRDYFPAAQLPAPWELSDPDPGQEQRYPTAPPSAADDPTIPPNQPTTPEPSDKPELEAPSQPDVPGWLPPPPQGYHWERGTNGYGWLLVPEVPYAPIPPNLPAAPPGYYWYTGYGTAYLVPNISPSGWPDPPYGYRWEGFGSGYVLIPYPGFSTAPSTRPPAPTGMYWAQNADGFWGLFPYPELNPPQQQPPSQPGPSTAPGDKPSEDSPLFPGTPPGIVPGIPGILPGVPIPVVP
ncbi:hypothetical protein ACIBCN_28580 [Nocardia sp. NPDC051052]|uniref:hypothetical protein n=1 Tax=Nocardia sp. NPDC051052 TaxID=3364322 RepID=UPI00379BB374